MTILVCILTIAVSLAFVWPLVDPILLRRDAYTRLLDRMEEEWDREVEPSDDGWRW